MGKKENILLKKGTERLDDVYFWLAVLRNFDQIPSPDWKKINEAYTIINEICKEGPPRVRWI